MMYVFSQENRPLFGLDVVAELLLLVRDESVSTEAEREPGCYHEASTAEPAAPSLPSLPYKISCSENHDSLLTIRIMLKNQAWEHMPGIPALTGSPAWEHMPAIPALTGSCNSLGIKNFRSAWAT